MPGEWTSHSSCWMAWPSRAGLWPNEKATEQDYACVANAIARFETVKMLVPASKLKSATALLGENVDIIEMPIDDSWTRDSGPNFLIGGDTLAGSTWVFNAWGEKYEPYDQDALMAGRILEQVGARRFDSQLVAEGGGVTVDGEGTIITTESCFPNANRNPGWRRQDIEAELYRTLGAEKIIWMPGDVEDTETDGHVDGYAAFIEPGRVLVEIVSDKSDPYYRKSAENALSLKNKVDARGRKLELEFIEAGIYYGPQWNGGCSSYINSYLANGAVIVPGYGYDLDEEAVETYQALYPGREIIQVPINNIAIGGGGVHCITQQQPAMS